MTKRLGVNKKAQITSTTLDLICLNEVSTAAVVVVPDVANASLQQLLDN